MRLTAPTAPRPPKLRGLSARPPSRAARRPEAEAKRPEGTTTKGPLPGVPRWWVIETGGGSYPEYLVWKWLRDHGYKPGVDFQFQSSYFGGRLDLGGLVADFIIDALTPPLIIRVQGEYWHTLPGRRQRDFFQLVQLQERGFTVVDAWEDDLNQRLDYTMNQALMGTNLRETNL